MEKEIRNVFFGEIVGAEVEYRNRVVRPYKYTVTLQDDDMIIELVFPGGIGCLTLPPKLELNEPVQVTRWSDGSATIERFKEN